MERSYVKRSLLLLTVFAAVFYCADFREIIGFGKNVMSYPTEGISAYAPECFFEMAKGLETVKEGGERCFKCYELRLREAAKEAKAGGYDYFTTTLTISPLKNAEKLNEIGQRLGAEYKISYLPSDFKKKNGYKRSVELSAEHRLYRQNYCGCVYSKREAEERERSEE